MRKLLFSAVLMAGLFCAPPVFAEKINNFDVQISLERDSRIHVTETIDYDFETASRHGIYRDIPVRYNARGGTYRLRLTDISVTDKNGFPVTYTTSTMGNNLRIKIGDADKLVSGEKFYVIHYTVGRAINYFKNDDELYWNVTGDQWTVPILHASAIVDLPQPVSEPALLRDCFIGAFGSTTHCDNKDIQVDVDQGNTTQRVNFQTTGLNPGSGLTVVVGVPKGVIVRASWWEEALAVVADNLVLLLPLLTLCIMFYVWRRWGRDPKGAGTIIPQYDVPDNLTPAEIGAIMDERVHNYDISADIIGLATRGYLKITRLENRGILHLLHDYQLDKLKDEAILENDFEKALLKAIFDNKTSIKLSDLREHFAKDLAKVKKKIYEALVVKGYFPESPQKVRIKYLSTCGVVLFLWAFFISGFAGTFLLWCVFASIGIVAVFGFFMPTRTAKGVATREYLLGLKLYLSVAEKDRIEFHNAPEKTPDRFEKFLPFAMVLKVEKAWAKQFEGIYSQSPSWYSDSSGRPFVLPVFIGDLGSFRTTTNDALSAQAASSGGSGLGGGGFSGGGFGGGGGGSW